MVKPAKVTVEVREKACSACSAVKPREAFFKDVRLRSGLSSKRKDCAYAQSKAWRANNPDAYRESYTRWRQENSERAKEAAKAWYARIDCAARGRERYRANRETERARYRAWAKKNRALLSALNAAYFAARDKRTPAWADMAAIAEVYRHAAAMRELGFDVHVDHIVPLRGKNVCGLHVHWNLRVVDARENVAKGNRLQEELLCELTNNPAASEP